MTLCVFKNNRSQTKAEDAGSVGFLVSILNFFGLLNENGIDRQDDLKLPAELTMMAIGLYGLYFAAVGFDLSNRKKRSLQGILYLLTLLTYSFKK